MKIKNTYKNLWDVAKKVITEKYTSQTLPPYQKRERSQINGLNLYFKKLEKKQKQTKKVNPK